MLAQYSHYSPIMELERVIGGGEVGDSTSKHSASCMLDLRSAGHVLICHIVVTCPLLVGVSIALP